MGDLGTVKMETVAHAAGVSQSLVSKVLNNRPGVSEGARRRVKWALSQTGYQPRRRAPQSKTIEVVFRTIDSALNSLIIRGLTTSLQRSGYSLTITAADADQRCRWLEDLLRRGPAGVVLVVTPLPSEVVTRFEQARIPVVVLDTGGDAPSTMNVVGSTHWRGGYIATRHLLEVGHRRIGMISGPSDLRCSLARVSGYQAALKEAELPLDPSLVRSGHFQTSPARTLAHDLLNEPDPPSAIVTGNDLQALGVIEACYDRHLRVPDDLSIVGYDDQDAAALAIPALTTVHQPIAEMADESGRILRRLIDTPSANPIRLDLLAELVLRKTTAAPANNPSRTASSGTGSSEPSKRHPGNR